MGVTRFVEIFGGSISIMFVSRVCLVACVVLSLDYSVMADSAEPEGLWAALVVSPTVASEAPSQHDLAALNPTLAGIELGGPQEVEIPWHVIRLEPIVPITPIEGDDNSADVRDGLAQRFGGPVLNEPRLAMRPDQDIKEPGYAPIWRSPTGDDLIDAFSQADKLAAETTKELASNPRTQPESVAKEPVTANPETTTETEPLPKLASNSPQPGLKPLAKEPELTAVPLNKSSESEPASIPERSTSPSTQSSVPNQGATDEESDGPPRPPVIEKQPLKPLTRNEIYLRNKLRTVLAHYYRRPLNSGQHDSWEVMHGMLAYGLDSKVRQGSERGEPITAIGWLCYNNGSKKTQLLEVNQAGELRAKYGVGVQGHLGQFLAMLAQCNVTRTYPIRVSGREFTIEDLIVSEQKTCYSDNELTFKLIALMHYLPSDAKWLNDRGEPWSIDRLIAEELNQPIRGAACGGTHRLAGLSLAARRRLERREPLDGEFKRAAEYTAQYEALCFRLQNSDGSFSTEWFRGPGDEADLDRRIRTTGHTLEWMLYQLDDEKLDYWRTVRAVNYLTNILYSNADHQWDTGALCHGLHALVLYDERKFQPYDGDVPSIAARTAIPASGKSPTKDGYGPQREDDRNSGFRLFGGRR